MSTVFVCAKNASLLRSLRQLLSRAGFSVTCFKRSKDMLETLENETAHCIVAEALTTRRDTIQLILKTREKLPCSPIILITNNAEFSHATDAIRAGATDFLETPIVDRLLIETLQHAITRQPQRLSN